MKAFLLLLPLTLLANSPFESISIAMWDFSAFNTNSYNLNKENLKNPKIKCRTVCDKKISREETIVNALSFYKTSKLYGFTR